MIQLENLNVAAITPLVTPGALKADITMTQTAADTVAGGRQAVLDILQRKDPRLLVVAGPCSIHDADAAFDYAERLKALSEELKDRIFIIMRTYFEKPRTTVGWKGLISDPFLDGSHDVSAGLRKAREILLRIAEIGLPTGTELLDPIVPQYIADLISWASIGARTSESQKHREMASGLSMPIGFKNSTDGNLQVAVDAMLSARQPHHFLGIDEDGHTGVVATRGNHAVHIILRGGRGRPNYDPVSVFETEECMRRAGMTPLIMVDCSHANCGKRHMLQCHVLRDVIAQRLEGTQSIIGVMLESNIKAGNQKLLDDPAKLEYGLSITDPCLDWDSTAALLRETYGRLAKLF